MADVLLLAVQPLARNQMNHRSPGPYRNSFGSLSVAEGLLACSPFRRCPPEHRISGMWGCRDLLFQRAGSCRRFRHVQTARAGLVPLSPDGLAADSGRRRLPCGSRVPLRFPHRGQID